MRVLNFLIWHRNNIFAREILALYGVEIPASVKIGKNFRLEHRGFGTVIHPSTVIGDRVRIYHQVTIGRMDAHLPATKSKMEKIVIGDDVVLFPGSKILGGFGVTHVGRGTIVAANAVLTQSTGEFEIWGGVPAKKISIRTDMPF